jgi:putative addiction module component (TIGR02574 family)
MAPRSVTREQLESEARNLPRDERARLAEALIASLEDEAENELAWQQEVRRRIQELDAGAVQAVPGEDVLAELDEIVRE